jgi:hypothetical protein
VHTGTTPQQKHRTWRNYCDELQGGPLCHQILRLELYYFPASDVIARLPLPSPEGPCSGGLILALQPHHQVPFCCSVRFHEFNNGPIFSIQNYTFCYVLHVQILGQNQHRASDGSIIPWTHNIFCALVPMCIIS